MGKQHCMRGHDHPRRAVSALKGFFIEKRLLERVQLAIGGKALNGRDLLPRQRLGRSDARASGFAPHQNRTSAALAFAAAVLGPGEAQPMTQD